MAGLSGEPDAIEQPLAGIPPSSPTPEPTIEPTPVLMPQREFDAERIREGTTSFMDIIDVGANPLPDIDYSSYESFKSTRSSIPEGSPYKIHFDVMSEGDFHTFAFIQGFESEEDFKVWYESKPVISDALEPTQPATDGPDLTRIGASQPETSTVTLPTGEAVSQDTYNALSVEQQTRLNELGIEGYNTWVEEQKVEFELDNVRLTTGEYISRDSFNTLSPKAQVTVMEGLESYNTWASSQQAEFNSIHTELSTGEYIKTETLNNLSADAQVILRSQGIEAYKQWFGNMYTELPSKEIISNEAYNALTPEQRQVLDNLGLEGYNTWLVQRKEELDNLYEPVGDNEFVLKQVYAQIEPDAREYLKVNGVDSYKSKYIQVLPDGDTVSKEQYDTLPLEQQTLLNEKGLVGYKEYLANEKSEFESSNVELNDGTWVKKEDFDALGTDASIALMRGGLVGLDKWYGENYIRIVNVPEGSFIPEWADKMPGDAEQYRETVSATYTYIAKDDWEQLPADSQNSIQNIGIKKYNEQVAVNEGLTTEALNLASLDADKITERGSKTTSDEWVAEKFAEHIGKKYYGFGDKFILKSTYDSLGSRDKEYIDTNGLEAYNSILKQNLDPTTATNLAAFNFTNDQPIVIVSGIRDIDPRQLINSNAVMLSYGKGSTNMADYLSEDQLLAVGVWHEAAAEFSANRTLLDHFEEVGWTFATALFAPARAVRPDVGIGDIQTWEWVLGGIQATAYALALGYGAKALVGKLRTADSGKLFFANISDDVDWLPSWSAYEYPLDIVPTGGGEVATATASTALMYDLGLSPAYTASITPVAIAAAPTLLATSLVAAPVLGLTITAPTTFPVTVEPVVQPEVFPLTDVEIEIVPETVPEPEVIPDVTLIPEVEVVGDVEIAPITEPDVTQIEPTIIEPIISDVETVDLVDLVEVTPISPEEVAQIDATEVEVQEDVTLIPGQAEVIEEEVIPEEEELLPEEPPAVEEPIAGEPLVEVAEPVVVEEPIVIEEPAIAEEPVGEPAPEEPAIVQPLLVEEPSPLQEVVEEMRESLAAEPKVEIPGIVSVEEVIVSKPVPEPTVTEPTVPGMSEGMTERILLEPMKEVAGLASAEETVITGETPVEEVATELGVAVEPDLEISPALKGEVVTETSLETVVQPETMTETMTETQLAEATQVAPATEAVAEAVAVSAVQAVDALTEVQIETLTLQTAMEAEAAKVKPSGLPPGRLIRKSDKKVVDPRKIPTNIRGRAITWRQGNTWIVIFPPYNITTVFTTDAPPTFGHRVDTGRARETLSDLETGGPPPKASFAIDWGLFKIHYNDGILDYESLKKPLPRTYKVPKRPSSGSIGRPTIRNINL